MPIVRAITDLVPYPAKEPRGSPSVRPKSDPPAGCRRFVTARWWMAGRYRDGGPPFIKGVRTPGGINSVKWKWKMEIIGGTELARSCGESAIRCRSGFPGGRDHTPGSLQCIDYAKWIRTLPNRVTRSGGLILDVVLELQHRVIADH